MDRRELYRTVAGLALAPLAPWLLVALPLVWLVSPRDEAWIARVVLALCYGAGLLVGLPAHWLLRNKRIRDVWTYTCAGSAGSGLLVFLCMALPIAFDNASGRATGFLGMMGFAILIALFFAMVGACAGFLFWLIAVKGLANGDSGVRA